MAMRVFGDSLGLSVGSSVPATLGAVPLVAAALGVTVSNAAVSGSEAGDQAAAILAFAPGASDTSLYIIGMNDQRHWGTNAVNLAAFKADLMAEAAWLSINNADIIRATSGSVTYHGTWGVASVYGSLPRWTDTQNDYCEFTVTGNIIYVATIQQWGSLGQEQVSIDGVNQGAPSNVSPTSNITTALGIVYMPKCYRFDVGGLSTTAHTVRITKTSATAVGSRMYFLWGWGNGMRSAGSYPALCLVGPPSCTPAGYTAAGGSLASTIAYNAAMREVQETLAGDGLNVLFVDGAKNCFPARQTDSGGCHPNDEGYWQLASKIVEVMA